MEKQAPIGVILAAGMAKRLRPLTDERPKCLLTVGLRTLLQRTVDGILDVAHYRCSFGLAGCRGERAEGPRYGIFWPQ